MQEAMYYLMHRNDPVCMISIDTLSGAMLQVSQQKTLELLPPGTMSDVQMLRRWWQRRAVPVNQGRIQHILEQMGFTTPQGYLVKNLGLSLTDHYWIKPLELNLKWENINLFTNAFRDSVGDMQFDASLTEAVEVSGSVFSPSSSAQGELQKKWIISNGRRCLIKGNHGNHSQESLNEVVAALLHKRQSTQPYVSYTAIRMGSCSQFCCICESFTSDTIELIPAIDVVNSRKKDNAVSMYEHFISVCVEHGLDEKTIRQFLEYQILTDFVLTNVDRHLNNFGVLRDTNTLKFIGMAPIFDSGNSMFWQNPRQPEQDDLLHIPVNSFRKTELQMLKYVQNPSLINLNLLPAESELVAIYSQDPLIPCIDSILTGYRRKIELLRTFFS